MSTLGLTENLRTRISEDDLGGLRIIIPPAANWSLRLFLPFWLCGWAVGESMVYLILSREGFKNLFLIVWLTFWTIGGFYACVALAWNFLGREVVRISPKWLEIRRQIGPFGRSKIFEMAKVRSLRYAPYVPNPHRSRKRRLPPGLLWTSAFGSIVVGVESNFFSSIDTHRIGDALPEIEARRLLLTIRQRFKFPEEPELEPLPIQS